MSDAIELHRHKHPGNKAEVKIVVVDEKGSGGAHHEYEISGPDFMYPISFQNGPVTGPDAINGVTHEALLAIVLHRLQSLQAGPFPCRENAVAATKVEEALMWLHERTRARAARGVEGVETK